jgi:hypothetical protein
MENWIFWLVILGGILSPFIFLAPTIRNLILGWRIPTTWISALPSKGWVEVVGRVRGEPVRSKLSDSECAYWQFEVKEYQSSGKGGGRWKTVHKDSSGPFEVDDMTGRVMIQATGNPVLVMENEIAYEKLDDATKAKLENLGIKTKGFLGFNKKMRVYERLIVPDQEILVLGKFEKDTASISISTGSIVPQVISNLTKTEMLKAYSWRTAKPMILPFIVSLAFLAFFIYTMFQ